MATPTFTSQTPNRTARRPPWIWRLPRVAGRWRSRTSRNAGRWYATRMLPFLGAATVDADEHGSQRVEDTGIELLDLATVRSLGVESAAARAVECLTKPELDGFWVHLDADVLDDAIMPAVDYRMPDGLSWDELMAILRACIATGQIVGINVTILNPKLDKDGAIACKFVGALVRGLVPEG